MDVASPEKEIALQADGIRHGAGDRDFNCDFAETVKGILLP
jgi:hypothetical protein